MNSDTIMVNASDIANTVHLISGHFGDSPGAVLRLKDIGKLELKEMLLMPLLSVLKYVSLSPTSDRMPHPPLESLMIPACIAALQMKESPR
jgi:hypothetical protein